jgi:hypothetical protein
MELSMKLQSKWHNLTHRDFTISFRYIMSNYYDVFVMRGFVIWPFASMYNSNYAETIDSNYAATILELCLLLVKNVATIMQKLLDIVTLIMQHLCPLCAYFWLWM